MKINVFGFQFETAKGQSPQYTQLFEHMAATSGTMIGNGYRYAVTKAKLDSDKKQEWWIGTIIKMREGKLLPMMDAQDVITAQDLSGVGRIADPTFFIVFPKTGRGLYTHHQYATSLAGFGTLCDGIHSVRQKARTTEIGQRQDLTPAQKAEAYKDTRVALGFQQLVRGENFPALIRELKKPSSATLTLAAVDDSKRAFRPISRLMKKEVIKFSVKEETDSAALAEAFASLMHDKTAWDSIGDAKVEGVPPGGGHTTIRLSNNLDRFEQVDYDSALEDLRLDFKDITNSLKTAGMIQRLFKQSQKPSVKALLESQ